MRSFSSHSPQETIALGAHVGDFLSAGDVLLLTGDLGAGKTQFSQGVGRALGVENSIISPTFNILLVHEGREITLNHWDLYRLDGEDDLFDIDYFALVESEAVSLVEWGDKFSDTYIDGDVEVVFTRTSDSERAIEMRPLSERGAELIQVIGDEGGAVDKLSLPVFDSFGQASSPCERISPKPVELTCCASGSPPISKGGGVTVQPTPPSSYEDSHE